MEEHDEDDELLSQSSTDISFDYEDTAAVISLNQMSEERIRALPVGVASNAPHVVVDHGYDVKQEETTTSSAGILVLDSTKAGMQTVDKASIERIINETSAGSKFYGNEQRKDVARKARLAKTKAKLAEFDEGRVSRLPHEKRCALLINEAKANAPLGSFIHFDMDAFYAAVEELLHPELKTVPFGVGGMGMLCTSNYLARAYGVRAGMPGYIAKKLCPELQFAWSGFEHYSKYSDIFKAIVREYDPEFTSLGMDELTMNATPFLAKQRRRFSAEPDYDVRVSAEFTKKKTAPFVDEWHSMAERGEVPPEALPTCATESTVVTVEQLAWEIRARVYVATRLTASAGIAPTPALAKVFSNFEKPDGQAILRARSVDDLQAFMETQPIRRIAGVGRVLDELMQGLGITTCKDVFENRVRLSYAMTPKTFEFLLVSSIGCQSAFGGFGGAAVDNGDEESNENAALASTAVSKFAGGTKRKSVGKERTFRPLPSIAAFMEKAGSIFDKAYEAFREESVKCRQVGIKLKRRTFDVHQTTSNLPDYTDDRDVLWSAFETLCGAVADQYNDFRLMGCRFIDLASEEELAERETEAKLAGPVRHQLSLDTLFHQQPQAKRHRHEGDKLPNRSRCSHVTVIDDEDLAIHGLSGGSVVEIVTPPPAPKTKQRPLKQDVVIIEDD